MVWIREYVAMLRETLQAQPPEGSSEETIKRFQTIDAAVTRRLAEVQCYLDRLHADPSEIN